MHKTIITALLIFFVLSPTSFQLYTQESGFIDRDAFNALAAGKKIVYWSVLPVRKLENNQPEKDTTSRLITGEIFKKLRIHNRWNVHWTINEPGHIIPDEAQLYGRLTGSALAANTGSMDEVETIMQKHGVDIIVTGLYSESPIDQTLHLRLLIFSMETRTIVMKHLRFKPGELVVEDNQTLKKALHPTALKHLNAALNQIPEFRVDENVKQLITNIQKEKPPKLFVSNVAFLDGVTRNINANTPLPHLLNGRVTELLNGELKNWAQKEKVELEFNQAQHLLENNADNVNNIMGLVFDPNMEKAQKMDKICNTVMTPKNVDIIVTGQYVEFGNTSTVRLQPVIIFKSNKKILTFNLVFPVDELICNDPKTNKQSICSTAENTICSTLNQKLKSFSK